jgi:hypothetical protein
MEKRALMGRVAVLAIALCSGVATIQQPSPGSSPQGGPHKFADSRSRRGHLLRMRTP